MHNVAYTNPELLPLISDTLQQHLAYGTQDIPVENQQWQAFGKALCLFLI